MAAPVDGSSGGWAARALRRALALTSLTTLALLASLTGLLLSGPAGALPTLGPGWQRQNPDPPVSRTRSLLLDAASGQLRLEDGFHPDAVAWANLTNAIRETGWAYLDLSTNGRYNDSLQAYAAGVVEASVSEELIYMHWMNTVVNYCGPFEYEVGYCEKLKNFLEANLEWMIVDYKAFLPNGPSPGSRVLTILEQIPGMVVVADKTAELYKTTYWASYNIPYFETVFNASGLQALVAQYGDWFSYTKNPRAKIFQRDQSLVEDMDAMVRLMRYNDFLHDPLSLCEACNPKPNAENAISARSDLNPAFTLTCWVSMYRPPCLDSAFHQPTHLSVHLSLLVLLLSICLKCCILGPSLAQPADH